MGKAAPNFAVIGSKFFDDLFVPITHFVTSGNLYFWIMLATRPFLNGRIIQEKWTP
jgi:hypothetical protein